jgi:hypothetical protein
LGHPDVHQDDVRGELGDLGDGVRTVHGLADGSGADAAEATGTGAGTAAARASPDTGTATDAVTIEAGRCGASGSRVGGAPWGTVLP